MAGQMIEKPSDAEAAQDTMLALQNSVYPGARDESIKLVLAYCRAANLDPLQKPVHIVPMWDKNSSKMRDVIMPGIGLYRTQASRSGSYAGVTEPEYGEDVDDVLDGVKITYPKWCRITVKRVMDSGQIAEFTVKERWIENYAVKGGKEKSTAPNAMWMKRPYGQLAKCAEAQALRKAFPEFGAQPTAEEMEGKSIEMGDAEIIPQTVQQPQAKSQNKPAGEGGVVPDDNRGTPKDAEPSQDKKPAAGETDASIMEGPLRLIRAKLAQSGITDTELCVHFKVENLEALKMSQVNAAIRFAQNGPA